MTYRPWFAPFTLAVGLLVVIGADAQIQYAAQRVTTTLLFYADNTHDIGASGATRPRDLFLSRNAVIGGTTLLTGIATFSAVPVFSAGLPTLTQNLIFTDASYDIGASGATRPRSLFLAGAALTVGSGTGVTVNDSGEVRQLVYKVTVAYTQFVTNGLTHDVTVATLPAKAFVQHVLADLTTTFACAAVCTTATLSMTAGTAAGGNQYLLLFDADAAAAQFGDADAEFGAALAQATVPTPIGSLGAWAATTPVSVRLTSAVGNLGSGAATNLSQGSVTIYVTATVLPD